MYKRRYRRRAPKRKAYKPRQRKLKYNHRSVKSVKDVKSIVRRVLSNNDETKMQLWSWTINPLCLQSATATLQHNYIVLNPSNATYGSYTINRGTGSSEMIGNKIRLKSCFMNFVITLNAYNATTNPQMKPTYVRAYIFRYKKAPQNDPQVTNVCGTGASANFFDVGTSDIGFVGTLEDLNNKMNTDAYTYLGSRTWKLGNAIPQATSNNATPLYTFANNDFKMSAFGRWNVARYMPKTMIREDGVGTWMDPYCVCMFQVIAADGSTYGSGVQPIKLNINLTLNYTDA